jgi:hypothetical protein
LTHIFQRGRYTTNPVIVYPLRPCIGTGLGQRCRPCLGAVTAPIGAAADRFPAGTDGAIQHPATWRKSVAGWF